MEEDVKFRLKVIESARRSKWTFGVGFKGNDQMWLLNNELFLINETKPSKAIEDFFINKNAEKYETACWAGTGT